MGKKTTNNIPPKNPFIFADRHHKLGLLRWVWLGLLALAELVWLSIRVDFHTNLSGKASWWAEPLSHANIFVSIVFASLASGAIVVLARDRGSLRELPIFHAFSHKSWPLVLAQLAAFAAFFWLSIFVVEGDVESSSRFPALWILAWAATGFGAGVFWLLAVMPAQAWLRLARRGWSVVLASLMIGAAAWAVGLFADMWSKGTLLKSIKVQERSGLSINDIRLECATRYI